MEVAARRSETLDARISRLQKSSIEGDPRVKASSKAVEDAKARPAAIRAEIDAKREQRARLKEQAAQQFKKTGAFDEGLLLKADDEIARLEKRVELAQDLIADAESEHANVLGLVRIEFENEHVAASADALHAMNTLLESVNAMSETLLNASRLSHLRGPDWSLRNHDVPQWLHQITDVSIRLRNAEEAAKQFLRERGFK